MPKRKLEHDDYILSKKIRYELTSNKRKYEYEVDFEPNKKVKITPPPQSIENQQSDKENEILKYIVVEMNKEINFLQHEIESLKNELEIYKNNNFYSKNMNFYVK